MEVVITVMEVFFYNLNGWNSYFANVSVNLKKRALTLYATVCLKLVNNLIALLNLNFNFRDYFEYKNWRTECSLVLKII